MFDVWCLKSRVWCIMSHVWTRMSETQCGPQSLNKDFSVTLNLRILPTQHSKIIHTNLPCELSGSPSTSPSEWQAYIWCSVSSIKRRLFLACTEGVSISLVIPNFERHKFNVSSPFIRGRSCVASRKSAIANRQTALKPRLSFSRRILRPIISINLGVTTWSEFRHLSSIMWVLSVCVPRENEIKLKLGWLARGANFGEPSQ